MFAAQSRRALALSLAALLSGSFVGCIAPQYQVGIGNENLSVGRLSTVRPVEVVVPPIRDATGDGTLPLAELRAAFQRGLVQRRYTPLALAFVDNNIGVAEASYRPGALGEQAVLDVTVTGWDLSRWRSHATLTVDIDIWMLDATDPDLAKALWGGHVTREVDLSRERSNYLSDEELTRRALAVAVEGILASLPPRDDA